MAPSRVEKAEQSYVVERAVQEVRDSKSLTSNAPTTPGVQVAAISGWRGYEVSAKQDLAYNSTIAFFGGGRASSEEEGRQFSQEFRLTGRSGNSLRWSVGAFRN